MNDTDGRESSLDRAIDLAVREMMHQDPRPGLGQRVRHRLNEQPQRSGWIGLGALATAALLVLVFATSVDHDSELQPASPGQVAAGSPATPGAIPPGEPAPGDSGERAAATPPVETAKRAEPSPESIFGPRSGQVQGASTPAPAPGAGKPAGPAVLAPPQAQQPAGRQAEGRPDPQAKPPAQLANLGLDVTIIDTREGVESLPKTVSVVTADRQWGRIRSRGGETVLNVDAQPEILTDGRIRLSMTVEYRPLPVAAEKHPLSVVHKTVTAILENGKPMRVSQSADPASNRIVRIDVKATILK